MMSAMAISPITRKDNSSNFAAAPLWRYDSSREDRQQFRINICYFGCHRGALFHLFLWRTEAECGADSRVDLNRCLRVHEVQIACLLVSAWYASGWLRVLRPIPDSRRLRSECQKLYLIR